MLQCRSGKLTGKGAVRIAVGMVSEKLIDTRTTIMRVEPQHLDQLLHPQIMGSPIQMLFKGSSPGKRGSIFYLSHDHRFLNKTLRTTELKGENVGFGYLEITDNVHDIWNKLVSAGIPQRCEFFKAKEVEDKYVEAVHAKVHTRLIKTISSMTDFERICMGVDDSVYFNKGSSKCAYLAAGSVLEKVAKGELNSAFAIVRPPGHHAEKDKPMGFCLYNNVAIATQFLLDQKELGINKILIVDSDVHHRNGTQNMFRKDPQVLCFSVHRHEHGTFYPCSDDEEATIIEMETPVFALRYMNSFTKPTPLASQVTINLSSKLPIVVKYKIAEIGYMRFYLAPKIKEDEEINGHHAAPPQAETTKQPEKRPTTKPKTNGEPKPKVTTNGNNDYVEVVGSKPGTGIVKPEEEIKEETNGEAKVMEVK
ncbi:histone deacetylase 5 [Tanacetum coccineum]